MRHVNSGFDDLLDANRVYSDGFRLGGINPRAARGLGVVTCIDSRIEPLSMLGLRPGDAKILRNAGARVTDDVLRTLVAAVHLLGVNRVAVVQHTNCAMVCASPDEMRAAVAASARRSADDWDPMVITDQAEVLAADLARIATHPLLEGRVELGGFVYDVDTGLLRPM